MSALARLLRTSAPLFCAAGVGLGAYASHADALPADRMRLGLAALFAFGHGLALIVLDRGAAQGTRLLEVARAVLFVGVLLFAGSLAAAALAGWAPALAPAGGSLLILGWVLVAADRFRVRAS